MSFEHQRKKSNNGCLAFPLVTMVVGGATFIITPAALGSMTLEIMGLTVAATLISGLALARTRFAESIELGNASSVRLARAISAVDHRSAPQIKAPKKQGFIERTTPHVNWLSGVTTIGLLGIPAVLAMITYWQLSNLFDSQTAKTPTDRPDLATPVNPDVITTSLPPNYLPVNPFRGPDVYYSPTPTNPTKKPTDRIPTPTLKPTLTRTDTPLRPTTRPTTEPTNSRYGKILLDLPGTPAGSAESACHPIEPGVIDQEAAQKSKEALYKKHSDRFPKDLSVPSAILQVFFLRDTFSGKIVLPSEAKLGCAYIELPPKPTAPRPDKNLPSPTPGKRSNLYQYSNHVHPG